MDYRPNQYKDCVQCGQGLIPHRYHRCQACGKLQSVSYIKPKGQEPPDYNMGVVETLQN